MSDKRIVWDDRKNKVNRTKHGVGFDEASDIFLDPLAVTVNDADHSWNESRFVTIGKTKLDKMLVVFFTETEQEIRMISARRPTRSERLGYEEER